MSDTAADGLDILFLIGCWEGESKRYRVYNVAEGLESWGYSTEVISFGDCREVMERALKPRVIVFFRAPFDPSSGVVDLLDYCRVNQIRTVFDVDDYVFEPQIIGEIAGVAPLSADEKKNYEWGVRAYRSMMFCCDSATASTQYLVDCMVALGRQAAVVPNSINAEQRAIAASLASSPRVDDGTIRISYFSGSKTHARDFAQCAAALQAVMQADPRVHFVLVGMLELDDSWLPFAERIERHGFMSPGDMLRYLAGCDINLAPLEEGNAFCEGKSELKFFEAALVKVPTVASRTAPYVAAIEDGVTGYLVSSTKEWTQALQKLAKTAKERTAIGQAARGAALRNFTTDVAAKAALVAYGLEPPSAGRVVGRKDALKIGWIVPGLIIGGGGHRNILRAAYHLERFGHDVRLYFSDTTMAESELRRAVRRHFYPFEGRMTRFEGHADGEDVMMATHWTTVSLAESVQHDIGEIMYFVQDFEPAFYPMGSEYIMAENTYRKGLYAISSGPWCAHLLRDSYGMEADFFQFPVDHAVYNAVDRPEKVNRVLFFAKPDMPRRCFLIGTMALHELHKLRPDIEIMFYGSREAEHYHFDFPVKFSGILPTINDLADLYASSMLGLVFSTTNPSLVPYEMMACGLPVVDLDRPGNEVNYAGRRDIALLANPEPAQMAKDMVALLDNPNEIADRTAQGIAFAATFPDEEAMAKRVESLIIDRVSKPTR